MDYIDITLDTGVTRRMEVVSAFNLKHYKFNYIIYCEIDKTHYYYCEIVKSHYYLAKYIDSVSELNTNFSDDEYELCKIVFDGVLKNGIRG